jgi:hypothetical protein
MASQYVAWMSRLPFSYSHDYSLMMLKCRVLGNDKIYHRIDMVSGNLHNLPHKHLLFRI